MTPIPKTQDRQDTSLVERVLERITAEHIVPRHRWEFIFKNYFFWTLGALAVALGALAFSAILFEIANVDWHLSVATHPNFISFFLSAAPFLWVLIFAIFILVGYINVRYTEHGYRYPLAIIALGAVLTSLTLGGGLYAIGFGRAIEESVGDHPPFYRPILAQEHSWWFAPEKGLLGGEVTQVAPDVSSFTLRDFSGRSWEINASDLHDPDIATVARGGTVRIVGLPTGQAGVPVAATSSAFHACFVFPWEIFGTQRGPLPPPFAAIVSTSSRNALFIQSDACKSIRPYQQLHDIEENN